MTSRRFAALAAALTLCLTAADGATPESTPYESYVQNFLSFSTLKIGFANRVNDLQADQSNRVWVATDVGVSAILVDRLADSFPLTSTNLKVPSADIGSVAFGDLGKDENFFLGYPNQASVAIQHGRMLPDSGVSLAGTNNGALTRPESGANLINGLSVSATTLWAATQGGLAPWLLDAEAPAPATMLNSGTAISHVVTDRGSPDGVTVYSSGGDLFAVPSASTTSFDSPSSAIVAMAFDGSRGLWVVARRDPIGTYELFRYPPTGNPDKPYDRPAGPYLLSGQGSRQILAIAVDTLSAEGTVVWLGTDNGAFFQLVDPTGDSLSNDGWTRANTALGEPVTRVYVDPSGNLWFGTNKGVRSLLARLVTINSSKFVGYGAKATIDLLDVNPNAPGPPPETPPDTLKVYIVEEKKSAAEALLTLTARRQAGTNRYRTSFTIGRATDGEKSQLAGAEKTKFQVLYQFGPGEAPRELPRPEFTWANIVKFEDDAWIGGPCFLKTVER